MTRVGRGGRHGDSTCTSRSGSDLDQQAKRGVDGVERERDERGETRECVVALVCWLAAPGTDSTYWTVFTKDSL